MVKWINHVAIAAPRNGTTSHTVDPSSGTVAAGTLFTPTAGNFLIVLCGGAVTSTTPSGWTLPAGGSAINNVGLYLWHRTAAGGDTVTTTHNASNYPCVFDFYEFAAGTAFIGAAAQGNVSAAGGAGPSLSGLTATANLRAGVVCQDIFGTVVPSYTWSSGTESIDTGVIASGTDGYGFSMTYLEDQTDGTYSTAATSTVGTPTVERLVFAVNAVAGSSAITGTLTASAPAIMVGPPTTSITGTVDVPAYAGDVVASAPAITVGLPSASISGTVAAPGVTGNLAADAPTVTVGPPTMAMSGTVTAPTYAGDLAAATAALTVGPPTVAMSGTVTAPGANQVIASTPTITIGPPASSIAGTTTPPVYAGTIDATASTIVIGPAELAMSGTISVPVYSGSLVASAPAITVGPPTAQIYDGSTPPLPTTGVSLTVSTGTRGLTVTTEARSLEVST